MSNEEQLVHAFAVLSLAVVGRGNTIYLKLPKDINKGVGLAAGDTVQIAVMRILSKAPVKQSGV